MNAPYQPVAGSSSSLATPPIERSAYRRRRGADPIATLGALGLGLGTAAALAYMNPPLPKKETREATIITMLVLPDDPPPAEEPPPPAPDAPPPPKTQITAPPPLVTLPPAPILAAPPPPPQPAPPAPQTQITPPAPVIARGPENLGDLSAQVVFRRPIRVPVESRRAHEEGVVVLAVLVGADGRVAQISIASSSGFPRLDRAALDAVGDWRWSPLIRNGGPVMVRGLVRIPFIRERGGRDGLRGRDPHHRHDRHDHTDHPHVNGPDIDPRATDRI